MELKNGVCIVTGSATGIGAAGAVAHLRDVRDHLLERGVAERIELHLDHRPEPHVRGPCRGRSPPVTRRSQP